MKLILVFAILIGTFGWAQVVDFENLDKLSPGDPVGEIKLEEADYSIQFYIGYNIEDTLPMRIQRVSYDSHTGGFYGPESNLDCQGKKIDPIRINQINDSKFVLNNELTNRERVGCYFISGFLKNDVLPSIFIFYDKPVKGCSADLLDVDGHENTIEAYDIYCYAETSDYPLNPLNTYPIEIRSIGRTFGPGILGDNGGVMPFSIDFIKEFTLIEIRPIQQVSGGNDIRTEFGFALDNYSPISVEQAPYVPPYLSGEDNHVKIEHFAETRANQKTVETLESVTEKAGKKPFIVRTESIYFDFDQYQLDQTSRAILDDLIADIIGLQSIPDRKYEIILDLSGYTDPVGGNMYNEHLSENRTKAALNYLAKNGVDKTLIKTTHHGENYDGESNHEDWQKRTVQIKLNYREVY